MLRLAVGVALVAIRALITFTAERKWQEEAYEYIIDIIHLSQHPQLIQTYLFGGGLGLGILFRTAGISFLSSKFFHWS